VIEIRCVAQEKRGHGDKLAGLAAGQGRGHGFYRGAGLFRVARILPVKKLRAKFEIATNVRFRGPPRHLWRPKPSVHLATPRRKVSTAADSAKPRRFTVEPTLDSWFAPARAAEPCRNVER
jgi:hypothetical protein